jgi:hypothetical protein
MTPKILLLILQSAPVSPPYYYEPMWTPDQDLSAARCDPLSSSSLVPISPLMLHSWGLQPGRQTNSQHQSHFWVSQLPYREKGEGREQGSILKACPVLGRSWAEFMCLTLSLGWVSFPQLSLVFPTYSVLGACPFDLLSKPGYIWILIRPGLKDPDT